MAFNTDPVHPLERIAEEFIERRRCGENPSPTEYATRFPEYADELLKVLSTICAIENLADHRSGRMDVPQRLGDYSIIREIGRGGMGIVCEAVQESLGRRVALKIVPPQSLANPTLVERFQREAHASARLHHTHIVPIYSVGVDQEHAYLAMQLIDGQSLDRLVRTKAEVDETEHGPFRTGAADQRLAATIGLQAADALQHAHERGILHRDIKPSNLLLDRDGVVWVTDFGLAQLDGLTDLTRSGDVVGTLRYLAPERFRQRADARSDVYSLGLTLYELLTGRAAFTAHDRQELLVEVMRGEPPPPRRLLPSISHDLETIVLKCLEQDPSRRYASAGALAEDLRRFLGGEPIHARRQSMRERAQRWVRRHPAWAVGSFLGLITMTALAVLIVRSVYLDKLEVTNRTLEESRERLADSNRQMEAALRSEQAARDLVNRMLYNKRISLAQRHLQNGDVLCVRDDLASCPEALRGWEWHYLRELDGSRDEHLKGDGSIVHRVAASHAAGLVAASTRTHHILVWECAGGKLLFARNVKENVFDLEFSPDGSKLVIAQGNQILTWEVGSWRGSTHRIPATSISFHPSGSTFAAGAGTHIALVDSMTNEVTRRLIQPKAELVQFSPTGDLLFCAGGDSSTLWDYADGKGKSLGTLPQTKRSHVICAAFRPQSRDVLAGCIDGTVLIWSVEGNRLVTRLERRLHTAGVTGIACLADGRFAVTGSQDKTCQFIDLSMPHFPAPVKHCADHVLGLDFSARDESLYIAAGIGIDVCRAEMPRALRILEGLQMPCDAGFTADGQYFAAMGNQLVQIWDARQWRKIKEIPNGTIDDCRLALSPDGRMLALGFNGGIRLCDLLSGVEKSRMGGANQWVRSIAWCPTGKRIVGISLAGEARIWDLTGRGMTNLPQSSVLRSPICFGSNGNLVLMNHAHEKDVFAHDSTSGKLRFVLTNPCDSYLVDYAVSRSGRLFAGVSKTGKQLAIWDLDSRLLLGAFETNAPSGRLAFSPDEKRLVIQSALGPVTLLDPMSGEEILIFSDVQTTGHALLSFHPDGSTLVHSGLNGIYVRASKR